MSIGPEAGRSVQVVGEISPGVCWDVAFTVYFEEVHVLQGFYDLICGKVLSFSVNLLCKVLVEDKCEEAGEEVSRYAVISAEEDRSGLEVGLGDAEALLHYPAASVHLDYRRGVIFKVGADAVEAVEA